MGLTREDLLLAKSTPVGFAYVASEGRYELAPHLLLLSQKLVDVAAGRIKRLIISMPPRHGKSELTSKYFPSWYLGLYPDRRFMLASYEAEFAASWGRKARDLYARWGPDVFGYRVSPASASASAWNVHLCEGGMDTAGALGAVLGKGAHCFVIDDPVKNDQEADSATMRQHVWDWYVTTAYSRLAAQPEGAMVIIMTRWHKDDLAGRLISAMAEGGEKWETVTLPAIAEKDDPMGRAEGEALWPAWFPRERLDRIKQQTTLHEGVRWWFAMYQQKPQESGRAVFKSEWFERRCSIFDRPRFLYKVMSVDCAAKTGIRNDYSSIGVWATDGVG